MAKQYVVEHPKLYMVVGGKLDKVEVGTKVSLTEAQAKKFGNKVKPYEEPKTLEKTDEPSKDEPPKDDKKPKA